MHFIHNKIVNPTGESLGLTDLGHGASVVDGLHFVKLPGAGVNCADPPTAAVSANVSKVPDPARVVARRSVQPLNS